MALEEPSQAFRLAINPIPLNIKKRPKAPSGCHTGICLYFTIQRFDFDAYEKILNFASEKKFIKQVARNYEKVKVS